MTYQAPTSSTTLATPLSITFAFPVAVSAPSTGTILSWSSVQNAYGTSGISVSSGALVLPAGYWYYIEGTASTQSATFDSNDYLSYKWRNDTTATYIGSLGRVAYNATSSAALPHSYDERAVTMLYAGVQTSITMRCQTNSGCAWANYQNAGGEPQIVYAGFGRALVIKLDGPVP